MNIEQMQEKTTAIHAEFTQCSGQLESSPHARAVEDLRVRFLGRKGYVTQLMETLREVDKKDRPQVGKLINDLRSGIEKEIDALKKAVEENLITSLLEGDPLDISLPVDAKSRVGSLHPVSLMRSELIREFRKLGFSIAEGPEVDLDFYNFEALNFPKDHPARDMQDTFFVADYPHTVLRTHTSNIQIHTLQNFPPPMRVVALGRTYRCDSDLTHTPMFHQIEGFIVDKHITMAHLKGVVDQFLKAIYGQDLETRMRPSFFPFVEPGAEVDLQCVHCRGKGCRICKETGWLEVGGMGMIHPNVFEAVQIDSEIYKGFAFGFGIDRMAMLKYGLGDLRTLFEGTRSFSAEFPIHSQSTRLT